MYVEEAAAKKRREAERARKRAAAEAERKANEQRIREARERETKAKEESNIEYPYIVETGKVFVMSDYRLNKDDSRMFGAVPIEKIKGKVIGKVQIRNI